ncbi:MAG: rhomboid family intramembrane serine protease [Tissierellia bacterium]|nr:rhomboid family intramembrane serine protease [Tissierellia bacterium]
MMKKRIVYNSPVVLTFVLLSAGVFVLNQMTGGLTNRVFFSVYRSPLLDPFAIIRLFGHVLGHGSWQHLSNNMILLLLVGPLLEEKYGSQNLLIVILATALVTGIFQILFFPQALLGASGVAFAWILLSSMTSFKSGTIPLTFLIAAFFFLGSQIIGSIFVGGSISYMAHVVGGITGGLFGYYMQERAA